MLAFEQEIVLNQIMSENVVRATLPPSDLGENRNLEIGYFGHGDIVISTWQGHINHEPHNQDGISKRFGFTHGNDALILASLAGYLVRNGKSKQEVGDILLEAGKDILSEGPNAIRFYDTSKLYSLILTAEGSSSCRFDIKEYGLQCLVSPTPSEPGLLKDIGGSAIYSRKKQHEQQLLYVLGKFQASKTDEGEYKASLTETEEFCEQDIPTMAQLVCELALGEYRKALHAFLYYQFIEE